jgi:hypothetical protein
MPRSSNPHFRSARIGGRANRPDLPVRAASRVKSSRGSETFRETCLSISRAGSNCCESAGRILSRSMRCLAYARGPTVRSFGSLDRARCYPICFFERS